MIVVSASLREWESWENSSIFNSLKNEATFQSQ